MTTKLKPDLVLIHGAWHSASCYDLIVPKLQDEGYPTTAVSLPSVGAEPPLTSIDKDVEQIRGTILSLLEKGREVIVVMHSYGAIPGSSSLKGLSSTDREQQGLTGGVVGLVYLCAWMIGEGESVRSVGGGRGGKGGPMTMQIEGNYIRHLNPIGAFYNDLPADVAAIHASKLKHHSEPTLHSPVTYAAFKHIPTTYLVCTEDNAIPHQRQLDVIEGAGVPISTFTCNAGHSPFLSQPDLVVRVIRHAAGEDVTV